VGAERAAQKCQEEAEVSTCHGSVLPECVTSSHIQELVGGACRSGTVFCSARRVARPESSKGVVGPQALRSASGRAPRRLFTQPPTVTLSGLRTERMGEASFLASLSEAEIGRAHV